MEDLPWIYKERASLQSARGERQIDYMDEMDSDDPFPEPVEIEITDVLDLHTIPPRDVRRVVEEYLQLAYEKGFWSVRIIHGKGIGVQREMVRSILARTPFVADWTDAPPSAGGLGATIVHFATKIGSLFPN